MRFGRHIALVATISCVTLSRAVAAQSDSMKMPGMTMPVRADVQFMRDMVMHHSQAIVMSRMVPTRSARADLKNLAERIDAAQGDEIKRMTVWLRSHGEPIDDPHAHPGAHAAMP